jgi:hypothetical protein
MTTGTEPDARRGKTMSSYTITANGKTMGTYEGATRDEAILAYVRDAGYASVEDAAETLGQTAEAFLAALVVDEERGLVAGCLAVEGGHTVVRVGAPARRDMGRRHRHTSTGQTAESLLSVVSEDEAESGIASGRYVDGR